MLLHVLMDVGISVGMCGGMFKHIYTCTYMYM